MSISESNARNAASSQKLTILGEATRAQLPVIACADLQGGATLGGVVGGSLKALFDAGATTLGPRSPFRCFEHGVVCNETGRGQDDDGDCLIDLDDPDCGL